MTNLEQIKQRYMQDEVAIRLGGISANLARIDSFSRHSANKAAAYYLLDESKYFIEWTAAHTDPDRAAELVELQVSLARWQRHWDAIWDTPVLRSQIAQMARTWSDHILEASGLLTDRAE